MRILFLNPQGNFDSKDSYWTEHQDFGGQLVYVKETAVAMGAIGINADIVTRLFHDDKLKGFERETDYYKNSENVRIIRISAGPDRFLEKEMLWPLIPEWVQNIKKFYEKEGIKPDFITGHYGDGGIAAVLLSKEWNIPFSLTGHSLGAQKRDKMKSKFRSKIEMEEKFHFETRITAEGTAMKYASIIFVSSKMEQEEQYGHPDYNGFIDKDDYKFAVVPPGVNRKVFNEIPQDGDSDVLDKISYRLPMVILASRIDEKKNHQHILKVFAQNKAVRNKAKVLIATRYDLSHDDSLNKIPENERMLISSWIDLIKENNIEQNVIFFKADSQKKLASLYRAGRSLKSVFCLPALYEPFGLTVIESMSCGLPVAATENGGPSEILFEKGISYGTLFNPESVEDTGEKLLQILSQSNYEELSERSLKRVKEKYTWNSTASAYIAEIKKVISNKQDQNIDINDFLGMIR